MNSADTAAAKPAPGVGAISPGGDRETQNVGGQPCGWLIPSTDGKPMNEPPHPIIAHTKVRHVGDQVALVIADSIKAAKDAAELIEVDYDVLPAVVDTAHAADPSQAAVNDEVPDNVSYNLGHG